MKRFSIILLFLSFFVLPQTTSAANVLDIIINEIAWMGTKVSSNDEWIELYNNTESNINLNGWNLKTKDGSPEIELSGIIPAKGFYLLERTEDATIPEITADLIYTGALSNSGEHLQLLDNSSNIIDEVNCANGWFAGDNDSKKTMERVSSSFGNNSSNWRTSGNPGGTPKAMNNQQIAEPAPLQTEQTESESNTLNLSNPPNSPNLPKGIVLNEILPSPEGPDSENEWIEIYNQNDFEVDLSGWKIQDTAGSTKTYIFPQGTKISANGYLAVGRPESKIVLNNDRDGLKLIQPNENVIDSANYDKALIGQSYNRVGSAWLWGPVLTPEKPNKIPEKVPEIGSPESLGTRSLSTETKETGFSQADFKKNGTADISRKLPNSKSVINIFLTALSLAVFSGIIFITLKKKLEKNIF